MSTWGPPSKLQGEEAFHSEPRASWINEVVNHCQHISVCLGAEWNKAFPRAFGKSLPNVDRYKSLQCGLKQHTGWLIIQSGSRERVGAPYQARSGGGPRPHRRLSWQGRLHCMWGVPVPVDSQLLERNRANNQLYILFMSACFSFSFYESLEKWRLWCKLCKFNPQKCFYHVLAGVYSYWAHRFWGRFTSSSRLQSVSAEMTTVFLSITRKIEMSYFTGII